MAVTQAIRIYRYINEDMADPRSKDFFLMQNPLGTCALLAAYLYFTRSLGPRLMEKRKPLNIENIMRLFDLTQIVLNGYLFYMAVTVAYLGGFVSLRCGTVDYSSSATSMMVLRHVHVYFLIKVLDLFDTVFFVLRKKGNQISFLHVYHHTGMVFGSWICMKYFPGGHFMFPGTVNLFVHTIMYTHYLVTSLKITTPWWKKYITQLQITQFLVILLHLIQLFWEDCDFPRRSLYITLPQNFFMFALFGDFYYKTYIQKPRKAAQEENLQSESCSDTKKDE